MVFQNTYTGFLYRQIFVTPPTITKTTCSLTGKTGIVTGSNTGLGYHASSQLLALGLSHLILAVRDPAKGEAAKNTLLSSLKQAGSSSSSSNITPTVEVWPLDMTDYTSINAFAERVRDTPDLKVDFCLLNAGVALFDYRVVHGNELTIQTNWLGTALLAILLRPILQAQHDRSSRSDHVIAASGSRSGRLVTKDGAAPTPPVLSIVGSEVAQWAAFKERKIAAKTNRSVLSVLNDPAKFNAQDRYYTSKLLLTLFFREFVARLPADNAVVVNIVNPGFCYGSELHRTLSGPLGKVFGAMKRAIGRSTEVGARTLVHGAVVAGRESHGHYLSDEKVAPFMDFPLSPAGEACGRELWREMEEELETRVDVKAAMTKG